MQAMKILKTALTTVLTLKSIEYEEEKNKIIYAVNESKEKEKNTLIFNSKNSSILSAKKNISFKHIMNSKQMKQQILKSFHKESDYQKRKKTYQKIAQQY